MHLSGVVLAGGESRRMGRDKAWIEAGGQPLLLRALSLLRRLAVPEIFVSGRVGVDYSAAACPVLLDREPGCGPLGGIERALRAASSPLLLVLPVDLPHLTLAFLQRLSARCDARTGVVPQLRGQWEPLVAIYPSRCHSIASHFIRKRCFAVHEFAEACRRERAVRTLRVAASEAHCFANWNTPADMVAPGNPPGVGPAGRRQPFAKAGSGKHND